MSKRDDFSPATIRELAQRVGYHCSNPHCRHDTIGPKKGKTGTISIGVASHITAAAPGGKRYNSKMTKQQRTSIDNGIWMCQSCSKLIDSDEEYYTVGLLHKWKRDAEREQWRVINTCSERKQVTKYNKDSLNKLYDEMLIVRFYCHKIWEQCSILGGVILSNQKNMNWYEITEWAKKIISSRKIIEEILFLQERYFPEDIIFFGKNLLSYIPQEFTYDLNGSIYAPVKVSEIGILAKNMNDIFETCKKIKLGCERYNK